MDRSEKATRRSRWLLPVLFAPVFMVILDVFIVNVTAPSLRTDLGATDSDLQWIVAAYLLAYAISLITVDASATCSGGGACSSSASRVSPPRRRCAPRRPIRRC
jgi:MFS family permease